MKRGAAIAGALVGAMCGACTAGPPAGFSSGDSWSFPLVDPLADDLLVTPVAIDGYGPFLFAIDPDANVSVIDAQAVEDAHLRTGRGPRRVDETGAQHERSYAELIDLKIGNLSIARRPAMIVPSGLYDSAGRHLSGLLGRDVLDDALVFGFNRDHGVAMLMTAKAFRPPEHGIDFPYQVVSTLMPDLEVRPVPRRVVRAAINGELYSLHLDLGATVSQLHQSHWLSAGLAPAPVALTVVDEAGTARAVTEIGTAKTVVVAGATRERTVFVSFEDQRWESEGVDGTLGLDFFAPFSVWMSWDKATCYLVARDDAPAAIASRLARWGSALPICAHPGCVTAVVTADAPPSAASQPPAEGSPSTADAAPPGVGSGAASPGAAPPGAAPPDAVTLTIVRDPAAAHRALQVVLGPTPAQGKPPPGWLVVNLTADADGVTQQLGPEYAGAVFQVMDVSPFPRACAGEATGCVTRFVDASDALAAALPPPPPAGPPPPPTIASDKLHRLTGEAVIAPSEAARQAIAAAGAPPAIAVVKLCLTPDGKVDSHKLVKTSKVAAYDEQLLEDIKATWTFEPVVIDGSPAAVCSSFALRAP